jgi:hypothetical protein
VRARSAGGAAWRDHAYGVARGCELVALPPSRNLLGPIRNVQIQDFATEVD